MSLPLTKVCDAADWFDPEVARIVRHELRETPRFHRKQWEFALVFLALQRLGLLERARDGLALGGGRERLLYALAPRVRRLLVTDLYAADTTWEEARTDDPDRYVREGAPFATDLRALEVRRMDMRELALPDASFDFAYSCCAVEHIGEPVDFAHHLCEVARVLRPGGAYVFTTEFHYGEDTVRDPGNFLFGTEALRALTSSSPLHAAAECWAALAPHRANAPLPEDVGQLFAGGPAALLRELPHVQLLRGAQPFTSAAFVLRKCGGPRPPAMAFPGLAEAREFLDTATCDYRRWTESTALPLDPQGYHTPTLFHTRYAWLGGGERRFALRAAAGSGSARLELRVHRLPTFGRGVAEPAGTAHVDVGDAAVEAGLTARVDPDSMYAFVGEIVSGEWRGGELATTVEPVA